jgi:hypothetical protein
VQRFGSLTASAPYISKDVVNEDFLNLCSSWMDVHSFNEWSLLFYRFSFWMRHVFFLIRQECRLFTIAQCLEQNWNCLLRAALRMV